MSSIAVKGADTGTGVFTIESPATNTDRTITLPDEAGTILTSGGAIDVDASAPADSVAIDASGNVGIGTASPFAGLTVGQETAAGNLTLAAFYANGTATGGNSAELNIIASSDNINLKTKAGDSLSFTTNNSGSEAMRIDSSGNLLVGQSSTTNPAGASVVGHSLNASGFISSCRASDFSANFGRTGTDGTIVNFAKDGTAVGSISVTGSSTAYNTSSDYRLKEDWQPVANAITDVKALKPCNFAWKADGTRVNGFLAHELAEVVPEAVHGEKDAVDDEGNPVYQGIDQSKLVPLLTAALQEAIGRIETLESRVATLEGGMA